MKFGWLLSILAAAMLFAACSGDTYTNDIGGGEGGTGVKPPTVAVGTISGFGSIFVNGVEFDTTEADVVDADLPSTEDALRLGMVVNVRGTINDDGATGIAKEVTINRNLTGPISAITADSSSQKTLTILGSSVVVDERTVFENVTFGELAIGQVVAVSGLVDSSEAIVATWLEKTRDAIADDDDVKTSGPIASINTSGSVLTVSGFTVNYADATFNGISVSDLIVGQRIAVKGKLRASGTLFIATEVRRDSLPGDFTTIPNQTIRLDGLISHYVSISNFQINGRNVNGANATATFGDLSSLADGVRVTVNGTLDDSGVLRASTINIQVFASIRFIAEISAVDSAASTVTVLNNVIRIDSLTQMRDVAGANPLRYFSIKDISVGDTLDIRGAKSSGVIRADQLTRISSRSAVAIQGTIEQISGTNIQILGITIDLSHATRGMMRDGLIHTATYSGGGGGRGDDFDGFGSRPAHRPRPGFPDDTPDLNNLSVGDLLFIEGQLTGSSSIQANSIRIVD